LTLGVSRTSLTVAAGAATVGLVLVLFAQRDVPQAPARTAVSETHLLVDADVTGAVVLSAGALTGYERDGSRAWSETDTSGVDRATGITCTAHCPAMVLSGTSAPVDADPDPTLLGDAEIPTAWRDSGDVRNTIVAVDAAGSLRLTADAETQIWQSLDSHGNTQEWPAAEGRVILYPRSAERTSLTAQVVEPNGGLTTYLFHASPDAGWVLVAQTDATSGAACLSPDGARWVLDSPDVSTSTGASIPIQWDIDSYSACAFLRDDLLLTSNAMTAQGAQTTVLLVDDTGQVVKQIEAPTEVVATASATSNAFVLVAASDRTAQVYDASGTRRREIKDVSGALFDEAGDLCLLDTQGEVRWVAKAQLFG